MAEDGNDNIRKNDGEMRIMYLTNVCIQPFNEGFNHLFLEGSYFDVSGFFYLISLLQDVTSESDINQRGDSWQVYSLCLESLAICGRA